MAMNMHAEKLELIQMLLKTTDQSLLKKVKALFKSYDVDADVWDELHEDIQNEVNEALIELENGDILSNEEVKLKHEKWLKK